jgi:hypothetical protein
MTLVDVAIFQSATVLPGPLLRVWRFCFGFALCCVALPCEVRLRLRPVWSPAGGRFLPPLSVYTLSLNLGRAPKNVAARR